MTGNTAGGTRASVETIRLAAEGLDLWVRRPILSGAQVAAAAKQAATVEATGTGTPGTVIRRTWTARALRWRTRVGIRVRTGVRRVHRAATRVRRPTSIERGSASASSCVDGRGEYLSGTTIAPCMTGAAGLHASSRSSFLSPPYTRLIVALRVYSYWSSSPSAAL